MEHCYSQLAYLGPGGPEFLLVMLVLLILFGAKDAPRILRKLNEIINQVRNTADGFKREVMYSDLNSEPTTYEPTDVEEVDDDYHCYDEDGNYTGDEADENKPVVDRVDSVDDAAENVEKQPDTEEVSDEEDDAWQV